MTAHVDTPVRARLSFVHPLRLRELLFWQVLHPFLRDRLTTGEVPRGRVALEFAPDIALRLTASDAGHLAIRYCGFLEHTLSRRITHLAAEGGVFVDVGANYGYFTCLWAAAGGGNRVIAFEPAPEAFAALEENVLSNQLDRHVILCQKAVGKDRSAAGFVESPGG
jgi:hypothetical protein